MYIPSELGYGDGGSPPKIKGGDVLIFRMEIIKIKGDKVPAMRCDPKTEEGCNDKEKKSVAPPRGTTAPPRAVPHYSPPPTSATRCLLSRYVAKIAKKFNGDVEKLSKELKRLQGMKPSSMKPELQAWMQRRMAILGQLVQNDDGKSEL